MRAPPRSDTRRQRGATLLMALFVMLIVTMVSLATARIAFDAARSAGAERDRQLALHAAEAGLLDAERDINGGANPVSLRASMFRDNSAVGFEAACGRGPDNRGLCAYSGDGPPAWQTVDDAATAAYGSYTGAALPAGGPLPLAPPRYAIERLPLVQAGEDAGSAATGQALYRITAFGYGARPETLVVVQSVYRRGGVSGAMP